MKFCLFFIFLSIGILKLSAQDLSEIRTYSVKYAKPVAVEYGFESTENGPLSVLVEMDDKKSKSSPNIKIEIGRKKFCLNSAIEKSKIELFEIFDSVFVQDTGVDRTSIVITFQTKNEYRKVSQGNKKYNYVQIPIFKKKIYSHKISVKVEGDEYFQPILVESSLSCNK